MAVKKKKEREKKKIRDTFCRTRIGGKIVLSICLHRVFKMQSPIRLSISPPASFRVYSTLSPARANTNTPLYSSASMMKPCRRCARTHVTAHTHRRKTRLITFSASFPLSLALFLFALEHARPPFYLCTSAPGRWTFIRIYGMDHFTLGKRFLSLPLFK